MKNKTVGNAISGGFLRKGCFFVFRVFFGAGRCFAFPAVSFRKIWFSRKRFFCSYSVEKRKYRPKDELLKSGKTGKRIPFFRDGFFRMRRSFLNLTVHAKKHDFDANLHF